MKNKNYFRFKFCNKNWTCYFGIANYLNNGNRYLGLYEKGTGELFSDISQNRGMLWKDEIQLDWDFVQLCPEIFHRLKEEWILVDRNIYWRVDMDKVREYECIDFS